MHPTWQLHLILSSDGPAAEAAKALGVNTWVVPFARSISRLGDASLSGPAAWLRLLARTLRASAYVARYRGRLQKTLDEIEPDLIHSNGQKMHLLGLWSKRKQVPIVWHLHDFVSQRPLMSRLLRWYSSRPAAILAPSESVSRDARSACFKERDVRTIWYAIDLDRFAPLGQRLDLDANSHLPPCEPDTLRIGLVATFAKWKGHLTFLRALSLLSDKYPVRAYIIGGPIYETAGSQLTLSELQEAVQALGLQHKVVFTGHVAEPAAAMRALDIVVHASTKPEPFGLVIAEAMACGRPVVLSAAGGAAEIAEVTGIPLMHESGSAESLAAQLERLCSDRSYARALGSRGPERAQALFQRSRVAQELTTLYLGVCREY